MGQSAHQIVTIAASEADATLPELGVTARLLCEAVNIGEQARERCTDHHPPSASGYFAWSDAVRALRDLLVPKGWRADDSGNYSTVVSPDGRTAIAVSGGDFGTGNAEMSSSTKHPKGRWTKEAIRANQLELFPRIGPDVETSHPVTWILLIARHGDFAASEISRPYSMSDTGYIAIWETRYILPVVKFDFPPRSYRKDDEDDDGQDYDIPVVAR